jgi:hypothetical protein
VHADIDKNSLAPPVGAATGATIDAIALRSQVAW